ncbi:mycothiol system anti-sigma-R factor [Nakamurella sp. YIM 132084]|uniref:Mycothiol system anti-sigma-R factor n=2 Tax=Nakamurella leprariae TaxID=2803911 RepID=A0A938YHF8_9ACTN|nr:mycothiol system anti-sigma-R factor [Nakamurella leprariae]
MDPAVPSVLSACTSGEPADACATVLRDVWLFLDDELDPANRRAVQQHLDDCSPCLEQAGLDHKLKLLLHNKCSGERAPEELRSRLVAKLRTLTVDASVGGTRMTVTETSVEITGERSDLTLQQIVDDRLAARDVPTD